MTFYRIHFEAAGAQWVIQLQDYLLLGLIPLGWRSVTALENDAQIAFETYEDAAQFVTEIGLNRMYRQFGNRMWDKVAQGGVH